MRTFVLFVRSDATLEFVDCVFICAYFLFVFSIACNELEPSTDHRLPNAFVIVSTMTPPGSKWSRHAQTEIIEVSEATYYIIIARYIILLDKLCLNVYRIERVGKRNL